MMARRVIAGSQRLWTPREMSTALWLDAADASTITKDGSNLVSQWNDKSGNARHGAPNNAGQKPSITSNWLNGKPGMLFSGSQTLSISNFFTLGNKSVNSFYYFLVLQHADSNSRVMEIVSALGTGPNIDSNISDYRIFRENLHSFGVGFSGFGGWVSASNNQLRSASMLCGGIAATTSSTGTIESYQNGSVISASSNYTSKAPSAIDCYVGSAHGTSNFLTATLGEIILLLQFTSTQYRQRMEGYLAHKWGLTANLPADHPYKSRPPRV